jgi:hypothetical protein
MEIEVCSRTTNDEQSRAKRKEDLSLAAMASAKV